MEREANSVAPESGAVDLDHEPGVGIGEVDPADPSARCALVDAGSRVIRISEDQMWFRSWEAVALVRHALATPAA